MPTPYSGNPAATQVPSPAPAPGVLPTVNIPNDITDDVNAASVSQGLKVPTDFIGHIQSAVRLDTGVVAASGSGFTAVSYSNFGGTVTPSGSTKISTGTRFVIKIIIGGAPGTASYQTSMDGGNTFGTTQTAQSTPTFDATSGILLAFSGTLTANGTASFRSAFTPQAQWLDASGNGRWLIDHNGLPMGGRISIFDEQWLANPGASNSLWTATGGAGGSVLTMDPLSTYSGRFVQLTPSSSGTTSYAAYTPKLFWGAASTQVVAIEFEVGMNAAAAGNASNTSFWFGFTDATDPASGSANMATLKKEYNRTVWSAITASGGIQFETVLSSSPSTGSNPVDRIKIELMGGSSPWGAQAIVSINEVPSFVTSHLPGAAGLRVIIGSNTEGGAPSGSPLAYVGPVRAGWNRIAQPPAY